MRRVSYNRSSNNSNCEEIDEMLNISIEKERRREIYKEKRNKNKKRILEKT